MADMRSEAQRNRTRSRDFSRSSSVSSKRGRSVGGTPPNAEQLSKKAATKSKVQQTAMPPVPNQATGTDQSIGVAPKANNVQPLTEQNNVSKHSNVSNMSVDDDQIESLSSSFENVSVQPNAANAIDGTMEVNAGEGQSNVKNE